jgi:hypothetical protein
VFAIFKAPDEGKLSFMPPRCAAGRAGVAIVDEVRQSDLRLRSRDPDGPDEQTHPILRLGEDMLDARTDFDLALLARRIAFGIGRPFGLLRWTWLTKPFLSRNASLAADL